ncbi:hypothetical protein [Celeribacter sp. PS-C1]|uniref:hypothetical protein n=1 Tax=Celeribacter sp. PS-C1 TaxID=2820813 RepID=UPI001CA5B80B|nr:hypothetical protein [Celeribacter sp. PS-C1]MBW6416487.1 hypothetical protein [Celeribacter sp. PS-C1]
MKKMFWAMCAPVFALVLSACTLETPGTGPRPPSAVTLPTTGLTVSGPSGFCVDTGSIRDGANGGFVLLGSCTGLSGGNNPSLKGKTAVLTLSASAPLAQDESFDAPSVEAFFASETGRKALSRSGSARTVTLIESEVENGRLWLHARDSAPNMLAGQSDEYWRALFVLKGRLVTVTATPFNEAPMPEAGLRKLLDRFVSDLQRRNPEPL